jgi:hypothetical protein
MAPALAARRLQWRSLQLLRRGRSDWLIEVWALMLCSLIITHPKAYNRFQSRAPAKVNSLQICNVSS